MHTGWQPNLNEDGLDALVVQLNNRYLILAKATDTADAEHLIMERIPHTRPDHLAPAHRN